VRKTRNWERKRRRHRTSWNEVGLRGIHTHIHTHTHTHTHTLVCIEKNRRTSHVNLCKAECKCPGKIEWAPQVLTPMTHLCLCPQENASVWVSLVCSKLFLLLTMILQTFSLGCPKAPEDINVMPRVMGEGGCPLYSSSAACPAGERKTGCMFPKVFPFGSYPYKQWICGDLPSSSLPLAYCGKYFM
jgi:hypothetical protein